MEPCGLMELRRESCAPKAMLQAPLSLAGLLISISATALQARLAGMFSNLSPSHFAQVIQDAQLRRFIVQQRTAEMMYDFGPRG